jgi:hypothetical protein
VLAASLEEKLNMLKPLVWDYYRVPLPEMLEVVEGKKEKAGGFDRDRLFVRSLERLSWQDLVRLWGIEAIKTLYTPHLARRLRSQDFRRKYDFAIGILRRETVSVAGWDSERHRRLRNLFLSDRWHRP